MGAGHRSATVHATPRWTASAPRWSGTVLYPLLLVSLFLGVQGLLALAGVAPNQRAAPAAVPALAALLVSLPRRLRNTWGEPHPWRRLGLRAPAQAIARALVRGLLKAAWLLALLIAAASLAGVVAWMPRITPALMLNAVALCLGVGFAEELLFRGWLLGELSLLIGPQRALGLQALVFSLVHTRFNMPVLQCLGLLLGLFLLGLVLALQRRADGGLLWGAIGLHGGLVGGWFLLHEGLGTLSPGAPIWLTGPGNPLGGLVGGFGLALLLLVRRRWWRPATNDSVSF